MLNIASQNGQGNQLVNNYFSNEFSGDFEDQGLENAVYEIEHSVSPTPAVAERKEAKRKYVIGYQGL